MKSNNFLNVKIWILHIIIYYTIINFLYQFLTYFFLQWTIVELDFLGKILAGPIGGIIGLFDNFPLFILIPVTIYVILLKLKLNCFSSYFLSLMTYLLPYIYNFSTGGNTKISFFRGTWEKGYYKLDYIFILLPSLIVSILVNWLVFRKTYKKLSDEK